MTVDAEGKTLQNKIEKKSSWNWREVFPEDVASWPSCWFWYFCLQICAVPLSHHESTAVMASWHEIIQRDSVCVCVSWASSLCFITADEWQKKWWNTVPKSNGNLLKYTGRISTSEIRMFSVRHFFNFSKETRTVDLTLSTATTDPLWFSSTRHCLCSNVSVSAFVSAGLASCRAEVVHPSLTGLASAVYHARVGGLCTYPSWRVRTNLKHHASPSEQIPDQPWKCLGGENESFQKTLCFL